MPVMAIEQTAALMKNMWQNNTAKICGKITQQIMWEKPQENRVAKCNDLLQQIHMRIPGQFLHIIRKPDRS
jgi:hypothetical protein